MPQFCTESVIHNFIISMVMTCSLVMTDRLSEVRPKSKIKYGGKMAPYS